MFVTHATSLRCKLARSIAPPALDELAAPTGHARASQPSWHPVAVKQGAPLRPLGTLLLGLCLLAGSASRAAPQTLGGAWRFTHWLEAPWGAAPVGGAELGGQVLRIGPGAMRGPAPLDCTARATVEPTRLPSEALFQGNLPDPAQQSARRLGLSRERMPGLRVSCDAGEFEFHQADADTLVLALDNRVWFLSRAPGTRADASSPAGRVQALLEQHVGGDMHFDLAGAQAKAGFQSDALNRRLAAYMARARVRDEAPAINGDPYTDSQEQPTRFAVAAARVRGQRARVVVRFADGWGERLVTYELVREAGQWRLNDLDFGSGGRLSQLLRR